MFKAAVKVLSGAIVAGCTATTIGKYREQKKDTIEQYSIHTSSDEKNDANCDVTEHNFVQGIIGNCGMVSAMATLPSNRELYSRVIPKKICNLAAEYDSSKPEFEFNLYKFGKLHKVVIDDSLPEMYGHLMYCQRTENGSFVGPLLEKALIQLLCDGSYESAIGTFGHQVLTSFTNSFFEFYSKDYNFKVKNGNVMNLPDLVKHGLITKSQMTVAFTGEGHAYTLVDIRDDLVKLYNPHGRKFLIPKKTFLDELCLLIISYYKNKLFNFDEISSFIEFTDTWSANAWPTWRAGHLYINVYDLKVEEDDTEVLLNVIEKPGARMFVSCKIQDTSLFERPNDGSRGRLNSFRANLNRGTYKIVVCVSNRDKDYDLSLKYLENGGDKFLFRLAASKKCVVEKEDFSFIQKILWKILSHW